MLKTISICAALCLLNICLGYTQSFDKLLKLEDSTIPVYYSEGSGKRAEAIGSRVDKAMTYYQNLLDFKPTVNLLVLSAGDWKTYSTAGAVYGMPHYISETKTLVVAGEDNVFWKSFLPPLDKLPPQLRESILSAYTAEDGGVSMRAFFDLLAIHELGHAFSGQGGLKMQRAWMGELYTNILLHTYVAELEKNSLPALTVFPKMVIAGGASEYKYTSLADLEERYNEIASKYPRNYGWYQCRWHSAAASIYDTEGNSVGRKLWDAFKKEQNKLTDAQLMTLLETSGARSVADMMRNWDANTTKGH